MRRDRAAKSIEIFRCHWKYNKKELIFIVLSPTVPVSTSTVAARRPAVVVHRGRHVRGAGHRLGGRPAAVGLDYYCLFDDRGSRLFHRHWHGFWWRWRHIGLGDLRQGLGRRTVGLHWRRRLDWRRKIRLDRLRDWFRHWFRMGFRHRRRRRRRPAIGIASESSATGVAAVAIAARWRRPVVIAVHLGSEVASSKSSMIRDISLRFLSIGQGVLAEMPETVDRHVTVDWSSRAIAAFRDSSVVRLWLT